MNHKKKDESLQLLDKKFILKNKLGLFTLEFTIHRRPSYEYDFFEDNEDDPQDVPLVIKIKKVFYTSLISLDNIILSVTNKF